jgi:glycerate 2-kinase
MVIKNIKALAKTELRAEALAIAEAGFESIDIERVFRTKLELKGSKLTIIGHTYDLAKFENVYIVGVGKGSSRAARGVEKVLGHRIKGGFVIDTTPAKLQKVFAFKGTHPLPSHKNIAATDEIVKLSHQAAAKDLVICIICGGGSALFCRPGERTCLELQFIRSAMLKAGAPIHEINTVCKHVSHIHGGHLAQYAYPATLVSLCVSDVPGDDLHVIASGPTVLDPTTRQDAIRLAKKYKLPEIPFIETPKSKKYFKKVTNLVLASGDLAVDAMAEKAKELGYKPVILDRNITGLAKEVGPDMAKRIQPGEALLAAGETEVHVTHPGRGGRCQDVATSAIPHLKPDTVLVACASDGKDNEPVAGAIADGEVSRALCEKYGLDPHEAIAMNDTYPLLEKLGDHLHTKVGTANVADFLVAIRTQK